jgi:hypothetical protein
MVSTLLPIGLQTFVQTLWTNLFVTGSLVRLYVKCSELNMQLSLVTSQYFSMILRFVCMSFLFLCAERHLGLILYDGGERSDVAST